MDQLSQFVDNMLVEKETLPKNRILDDTIGMVTSALSRRFREEYLLESDELDSEILRVETEIKHIRASQKKNPFAS